VQIVRRVPAGARTPLVLLLPLLAAGWGAAAETPSALSPGDRARGDLSGSLADEDRVRYALADGAAVAVRLRGCGPGSGAPALRVERPDGSPFPVAPEGTGARRRAAFTADAAGEWVFVLGPPADGVRRDWRLRVTDDGPRPADPGLADLSDITAWRGNVGPLVVAQCGRCHFGIGAPGGVRLRSYAQAVSFADRVRVRVADRSMPADRPLSPSQVDRILRWVDGGTPLR